MPIMWRGVRKFESRYQVSTDGRVRNIRYWRMIKPRPDNDGYLHVTLGKKGIVRYATVHRLVAEAFLGRKPPRAQVNHKDGIKSNNHYKNLEWKSGKGNIAHAKAMGLFARGERHGSSVLDRIHVAQIRKLYASRKIKRISGKKITMQRIAKIFGVSTGAVCSIVSKKNWAWLES